MRYHANGFIPVNETPAIITKPAAAVAIVKGDVLHDDGSGYATNAAVTLDSATFLGVAASSVDNSGGSQGDKNVEIYPLNPTTKFMVPVASSALITQTAVGTWVDLEANDDIDLTDAVTTGLGFFIDDLDASTEAIDGNTYGYAIGHFGLVVTES
jgi:hypothetical protein